MKKIIYLYILLLFTSKTMAQSKISETPSYLYKIGNENLPTVIFNSVSNQRIKNLDKADLETNNLQIAN